MSNFRVLRTRVLPSHAGKLEAEIILCELPDNTVTPYVTWQRNVESGGRYWGHYFGPKELADAEKDFEQRGH